MPTSNRARYTWQPGEIKTEDGPEPGDQKMLPGWFPGDFKTDPELLSAFEDGADWHAAGSAQGGQQHVASLRHLAAHGTPAQKKAAAAVLARMGHSK